MQAANQTFISSTSWSERTGPAAALRTIQKFAEHNVHKHLIQTGKRMKEIWADECRRVDLRHHISGIDPLCHLELDGEEIETLFIQEMMHHNILSGPNFYSTYAHTSAHLDRYQQAMRAVLSDITQGRVKLTGPVRQRGFQRMT
jgi:glutamate-1-semialdehyde 2,1-aminomutase